MYAALMDAAGVTRARTYQRSRPRTYRSPRGIEWPILGAMKRALLACLIPFAVACGSAPLPAASPAPPPFDRGAAERDVAHELDDLHDAAARADLARYFAHYAPGAIFLGTDATERWDLVAFHAHADPRFAGGKAWVFHVVRRGIDFSPDGAIAWFDEDLRGDELGAARGSGVLVRDQGRWRVSQYNLALTVPNERFDAVRAAIDGPAPVPDLHVRSSAVYRAATAAAAAGDLEKASALLLALVPEAKARPDDELEFWLHNELTWVRWAAGDLAGARAEVERARTALDHGLLPDDKVRALRLHELWDRAYLALEDAVAAPGPARAGRIAAADAARAAYEALAKPAGDHDGMAVLAAFFAVRKHDGRAAAAEARKIDPEKDDDMQDLYVIALALEAAGDHEGGSRVRARICRRAGAKRTSGADWLMKPLVVRALAAEGHPCAK
jgi:hypothetical protein